MKERSRSEGTKVRRSVAIRKAREALAAQFPDQAQGPMTAVRLEGAWLVWAGTMRRPRQGFLVSPFGDVVDIGGLDRMTPTLLGDYLGQGAD